MIQHLITPQKISKDKNTELTLDIVIYIYTYRVYKFLV